MNRAFARSAGFSLVEMTLVLLLAGLIGAALWALLPLLRPVDERLDAELVLENAERALVGFALANHRLPCPAASMDGREDCQLAGAAWLPRADLGLSGPALRYGVYRGPTPGADPASDLAVAADRFVPRLPPNGLALSAVNGLDLCQAVHTASQSGLARPLNAGTIAQAFALAHPGRRAFGNDPRGFDGANALGGFELMDAQRADYDDRTRLAGFAELAGRLGCPVRLAAVDGAARAAYVAYDRRRYAELFYQWRLLDYDALRHAANLAESKVVLAASQLVIAIGTATSALYLASATAGIGAPEVAAAFFGITGAIASTAAAALAQEAADKAESVALEQSKLARGYLDDQAIPAETAALALLLDTHERGLLP